MQAPPSQDEIDLYNEYWNTLSGNSNTQVIPDNIIVNFYKASNLNNQCLEEIWKLSNPNNVKSISKAEFFLGVRLIALAQKGYNVSNLPMNITIPQPMFMGYENVLRQFQNKKMLNQQSSFNSMGMNSQPISQQHNLLTSSYMSNSSNTSKIHSFSNNTSPVEWFIRQAKRSEYSNTFDKFQKNNVFQYKSLQDLVKDDPVNENDLDKIWSLLDKYNIKVIRKGQFIIFMHILESCKSGDAIPSSLPYSIIQSVGAAQEMEDRTVPAEPDLMSSSVNNNDSNKFDFFNNGNNDNNKTSSTSFFDSNNNNSTSFFNNNNNNNSNNNDSTSFFNNTNNNNNSSNNDSTSFFNNTNNNNNNNNNSTSFFNNNNNMNNNNSNSNDFFNSNNSNNNNANANTNNQNSFFNNTSTSNENNNLFGNSGKPSMNTPAINVASLEDYSNLLEYKKKYLENLKSDISKLQTSIDNLNNNKYSNPSIYSKLEDLIQNMNNETTEINNCKRDIQ